MKVTHFSSRPDIDIISHPLHPISITSNIKGKVHSSSSPAGCIFRLTPNVSARNKPFRSSISIFARQQTCGPVYPLHFRTLELENPHRQADCAPRFLPNKFRQLRLSWVSASPPVHTTRTVALLVEVGDRTQRLTFIGRTATTAWLRLTRDSRQSHWQAGFPGSCQPHSCGEPPNSLVPNGPKSTARPPKKNLANLRGAHHSTQNRFACVKSPPSVFCKSAFSDFFHALLRLFVVAQRRAGINSRE